MLGALARGLSNAEIAQQLYMSEATVKAAHLTPTTELAARSGNTRGETQTQLPSRIGFIPRPTQDHLE